MEDVITRLMLLRLEEFTYEGESFPIAMPEIPFAPPADDTAAWLEADLGFATTNTRTLARGGSNEHRGILQVTVVWPRNRGVVKALQVAVALCDHFPRELPLVQEAVRVTVSRRGTVEPYQSTADRLRIPVRIPYVSFIKD